MAKGIAILFHADNDDVVDKSREVQDELEEIGERGQDAGRTASDGLKEVERSADDASDAVSTGAGGAFGELESQADDALGGIGDELLGVAGIAGGVGGIVATAVGGAVDFVTTQVQAQIDKVNELKGRYSEMYAAAAEGSRTYLEAAQVESAARDILFGEDTAQLERYREEAERIGVSISTYVLAQAGSYSDLQVVIEAAAQAEQDRLDIVNAPIGGSYDQEVQAIQRIQDELALLEEAHATGQENARTDAEIRDQLYAGERDAIAQNRAADQDRWNAYAVAAGAAIASVPSEQTVIIRADTSEAERAIASFQRQQRYANVEVQLTKNGVPVY